MHVQWNSTQSPPFSLNNGVKQVLSPILIYIDSITETKESCNVGRTFALHADDLALISPSLSGLRHD